jgi:dTDP-4-dehydrorhamnose 3,5-epimerase
MPLKPLPTNLSGPILLEPTVHEDNRGFFIESYRRDELAALGIGEEMVQDNHSRSREGVVRGLHFQVGAGIAKLVRCVRGAILDVVVDLRKGSPTYGRWEAFQLDDRNLRLLYCPVGFAHGFCVLSPVADVVYKQSGYYNPNLERTIAYNDPRLGIEWPFPPQRIEVSPRDAAAPRLEEIEAELPFRWEGLRAGQ